MVRLNKTDAHPYQQRATTYLIRVDRAVAQRVRELAAAMNRDPDEVLTIALQLLTTTLRTASKPKGTPHKK